MATIRKQKKRTTTKKAGSTKRTTKATAGKPKKLSQIDAAIKLIG